MKNSKNKLMMGCVLGSLMMVGCAHREAGLGTVAMKHTSTEAHVYLHTDQVKEGDQLSLYKHECKDFNTSRGPRTYCTKVKYATGQVVQVLNEHYCTIKVAEGVKLDDVALVQKD